MVSDHVSVRIDGQGDRLLIEAAGDTEEVSFEIAHDDIEFGSIEDAKSWVSLDSMKKLVKNTPTSADVTVSLGTDFPLIMRYKLADRHGHVTRMQAPRIRSD